MPKIKVLQDTPFHLKGDIIDISTFRLVYNFMCTNDVTNEEFIIWMRQWRGQPITLNRPHNHPGKWFELVEDDILPDTITVNGIVYTKKK